MVGDCGPLPIRALAAVARFHQMPPPAHAPIKDARRLRSDPRAPDHEPWLIVLEAAWRNHMVQVKDWLKRTLCALEIECLLPPGFRTLCAPRTLGRTSRLRSDTQDGSGWIQLQGLRSLRLGICTDQHDIAMHQHIATVDMHRRFGL